MNLVLSSIHYMDLFAAALCFLRDACSRMCTGSQSEDGGLLRKRNSISFRGRYFLLRMCSTDRGMGTHRKTTELSREATATKTDVF